MANKNDIPVLILASIVVLTMIFLSYSKYFLKENLEARIVNQTSSCYSGQASASLAEWSAGNIAMTTSFETNDPCYWVSSIAASQQGDRIEVKIKTSHEGICIQCFGFREVKYVIMSPETENGLDIYINVDEATKHYVRLSLLR